MHINAVQRVIMARAEITENLLRAMVDVESSGDPWAMRPEPTYRWLWDIRARKPYRGIPERIPAPPGVSRLTELWGQRISWGPLQVMGAVARELGYDGPYLSALCEPSLGLTYGLTHLENLSRRFRSNWGIEGIVAAFNAGSPRRLRDGRWENQPYVDKVRAAGGLP